MANLVSWEMYKLRKRLNVENWLKIKGIENYEQFCNELKTLGIKVPQKSIEKELFKKPKEAKKEKKKENRLDKNKEEVFSLKKEDPEKSTKKTPKRMSKTVSKTTKDEEE